MRDEQGRRIVFILPPSSFILSKCCSRSFMEYISARVPNVFHFANHEFDLLIAGIEMWRNAYSGAGTKIDKELATNQFFGDRSRVFMSDCDCAAPVGCILWTRHFKACFLGQLDQPGRLPHTLFADFVNTDLIDYSITRLCCIERRYRRRAMKKPRDAWRITKFRIKGERRLMRHPAGRLWLELVLQVRTYVEIPGTRATTEPFDRTAGCEIHVELFNTKRHSARGLISIKYDHCAHLMSTLRDGFSILQKTTLEEHVREGHEQSLFVNGGEKTFKRNSYAVVRLDCLNS